MIRKRTTIARWWAVGSLKCEDGQQEFLGWLRAKKRIRSDRVMITPKFPKIFGSYCWLFLHQTNNIQSSPKILGHFQGIFGPKQANSIFWLENSRGGHQLSGRPCSGSFNQIILKICGPIWVRKWLGYIRAFSSIIILEAAQRFLCQILAPMHPFCPPM